MAVRNGPGGGLWMLLSFMPLVLPPLILKRFDYSGARTELRRGPLAPTRLRRPVRKELLLIGGPKLYLFLSEAWPLPHLTAAPAALRKPAQEPLGC
ncbi:hypothetical protein C8F01DRAFT_448858 [Mycena amicta]|nr:hypothetical protein C8F01DRAFT_448858 [Mycena amicta]